MKKIIWIGLLALVVVFSSGCKKETTPDTLAIYGLWQVTQSQLETLKYIRLNTDKTMIIYSETPTLFRGYGIKNFSPGTDQIIASFFEDSYYPAQIYNYTIVGDVLTVVGDNGIIFLTATRTTSAVPDTWVTPVTSSYSITGLFDDNSHGIGFDGTNLLFVEYNPGKIYKVSTVTDTIVGEISTSVSSLNTVESDGINFWVSSNGHDKVYKLDATGNQTFVSTPSLGAWIYGIAYLNSGFLACYSNNEESLFGYNPATDAIVSGRWVPEPDLYDMAAANGKLYICSRTLVYRLNATTFEVEKTYRITGATDIRGIAAVGSNTFWLNTNSGTEILKVTLD